MSAIVDVLLSTYNGDQYLREQLDSLIAQTFTDWRLLARDDCSTDNTPHILTQYADRYSGKITVIRDVEGRLGPVGSFEKLLQLSSAPYIAFCDQDDVWLPDKLQRFLDSIKQSENKLDCEEPLLIHSDPYVVNDHLEPVAESFWAYQKLNPDKMQTIERLLVQNCVTGCATLFNRRLVDIALPIPEGAIMHDWWFALVAATEGRIVHIDDRTIAYRQHAKNLTGAKKWGIAHVIYKVIDGSTSIRQSLYKTQRQAIELHNSGILDDTSKKVVGTYVEMFNSNWFLKRATMLRGGFIKHGWLRNLAMLILL